MELEGIPKDGRKERKMNIKKKVIAFLFLAVAAFASLAFQAPVETQAAMADNAYTKPFNAPYYEYRVATTYQSATSYPVGWNKQGGRWFYMTDSTHYYREGLATIDGKNYLFDHDGYCVTGWVRYTQDVKWGLDGIRIMYFDPTNAWMLTGYQEIDGIGRSFGNSGYLQIGRGNKLVYNNKTYMLDDAAVCSQPVQSEGTPLTPAKNTFKNLSEDDVVSGNYEFQAQMLDDTEIEVFGYTPIPDSQIKNAAGKNNYFCIVKDDSLKGKIGAWYRNVGTYHGRVIDAKATVTDYELFDHFGQDYGLIGLPKSGRLGLAITHVKSAEITFEFYDHETGEPVEVQGFATITDIDFAQACEITSPYDTIYVADDCEILYTQSSSGTPIFADDILNSKMRTDYDTSGQVLVEYTGNTFSYRFYNDMSFWNNTAGDPYYTLSGDCLRPFFSESDVYKDTDLGQHSWQGYSATRFARVETPHPPTKTVSDNDEKDVTEDTLGSMDESFTYKISENVPMQADSRFYYTNYQIVDKLEPCLDYVSARVETDAGTDVSSLYNIGVSGQTVTFTCKDPSNANFYGQTYHYIINVKIDKSADISSYLGDDGFYRIPNKASLIVKSDYEDETYDTNEVITKVKKPEPAKFTIALTKTSADTSLTDGNANYSLQGAEFTVYKDQACTSSVGKITTDASGKGTITGLTAGKYWVKETKAPLGYALDQTVQVINATNATSGQTYTLNVKDVPLSDPVAILLKKVDESTGKGEGLKDAQFEVKYYTSIMDTDPAAAGLSPERTWVFKTDDDGALLYDTDYLVSGDDLYLNANGTPVLPYGTLTFKEIKAPEGYLVNSTVIVAKIDKSGSTNITYNEPTQKEQPLTLRLTKTEEGSGKAVKGVEFTHTDPDGKTKVYTTDQNGKLTISNLAYGNHTLVETKTVGGLQINTHKIQFTVGTDNKITITSGSAEATETNGKVTVTVASDGCIDVAMENKLANFDILVHKVNENSTKLEGAKFALYSDPACENQISVGTTNKDGELNFPGLKLGTNYFLKEIEAPSGYQIPVNDDGSAVVYKINLEGSAVDGKVTLYVNDKAYTSDSGQFHIGGTKAKRVADITVINQTGLQLPETGSNLTLIILMTGIAIVVIGGILVWRRKKK